MMHHNSTNGNLFNIPPGSHSGLIVSIYEICQMTNKTILDNNKQNVLQYATYMMSARHFISKIPN